MPSSAVARVARGGGHVSRTALFRAIIIRSPARRGARKASADRTADRGGMGRKLRQRRGGPPPLRRSPTPSRRAALAVMRSRSRSGTRVHDASLVGVTCRHPTHDDSAPDEPPYPQQSRVMVPSDEHEQSQSHLAIDPDAAWLNPGWCELFEAPRRPTHRRATPGARDARADHPTPNRRRAPQDGRDADRRADELGARDLSDRVLAARRHNRRPLDRRHRVRRHRHRRYRPDIPPRLLRGARTDPSPLSHHRPSPHPAAFGRMACLPPPSHTRSCRRTATRSCRSLRSVRATWSLAPLTSVTSRSDAR